MTEENKELKIEFAPGCFDSFEGTQEELDELVKEIQSKLANMTPEELEAQSRSLDDDEIEELLESNPELAEQLLSFFEDTPPTDSTRKLQ